MKTTIRFMTALAILVLTPLLAGEARATQIFSDQTAKNCDFCHIGRPDNLEFTADGNLFVQNYYQFPSAMNGHAKTGWRGALERKIRHLLLALHATAGVALAGTAIFLGFVPRQLAREDHSTTERKFIWVSMGLAIGGGAALIPFVYTPDIDFWQSTYGAYLGLKIVLTNLLMLLMILRLIVARRTALPRHDAEMVLTSSNFSRFAAFSPADLKHFTGRKGRRALIAFKGKIYDVTDARHWNDGLHLNKHSAGTDLTKAIAAAPHGEAVLNAAKEVGIYDPTMTASGNEALRRLNTYVGRFNALSWASAMVATALAVTLAFWRS